MFGSLRAIGRRLRERMQRSLDSASVTIDDTGFTVVYCDKSRDHVEWSNVARIHAFKADHGVTDCICLAFDLTDGVTQIVDEEIAGFDALASAVEQRLGFDHGWWSQVAFPAFVANSMQLWIGSEKL